MVTRDIIQRLLAIINETRGRVNTLESREVALLTATQTLTNKTLTTPTIGDLTNAQHAHTNAASGGTIAHGSLTGLTTGDPHTQYLLKSTYDANTIIKADTDDTPVALTVGASTIVGRASTGNIVALTASQVATIVQGSVDHGSITGLGDDDHTQYALLAGRSGGQSFSGGTAANDDLTLQGTTNATRTTSYVLLQPNGGNVGIGTTSPNEKLTVSGGNFLLDNNQWYQGKLANGTSGRLFGVGADDILYFGGIDSGFNEMRIRTGSSDRVVVNSSGNVGIGTTSPDTRLDIGAGAIEFAEMTAPSAGAVNTGRLFCQDNGSGKTQLCIIFNTGTIQVIATQP